MTTLRLKVPDISCAGCVVTIRMAAGQLGGVNSVDGDSNTQTITVEYDPAAVTVDAIRDALSELGYESTPTP